MSSYAVMNGSVVGRGGAIAIRDYLPESPVTRNALLWVHGGGFTSGGLDQKESDAPARVWAAAGHRVRTLDYQLAPRKLWGKLDLRPHPNRFPAALEDVLDVVADLQRESGRAITLGGGSAGANLAAGAVLALRDQGQALPRSVVLGYGTFHAELPEDPEVEEQLRGPLARRAFNPKMTRRMNLNYVGDAALLAPGYAFPGGAVLDCFPPTLIIDSCNDRLRASGAAFADELRQAGVEVERLIAPGTHAYFNAPKSNGFAVGTAAVDEWLTRRD